MKLRITNNRKAPHGVEQVSGSFFFIPPGKTRVVDAANPGPLYDREGLDVEAEDNQITAPSASMKARVLGVDEALTAKVVEKKPHPLDRDGNGKKGGSRKGTRRRKVATR
jgi:hypothetical protein